MNAVIKTGGKQYLVSEGSVIFVEKLAGNEGDKVVFDEVLMLDSKVGNPYVSKASVEGVILKQGKAKKIRVFKYSQKDRSNRRTHGHRQPYTKVEITSIKTATAKTTAAKEEKVEAKPAAKATKTTKKEV